MNLSDVNTLFGIGTGFVLALAWLFRLESQVKVLQMELKITKEYQKETNEKLDKRLTDIQNSLDNLTHALVK